MAAPDFKQPDLKQPDLKQPDLKQPDGKQPDGKQPDLKQPGFKQLVLIGFMGAGKTTVGKLVADALQWQFVDADAALVEETGRSIAEIFLHQGEDYFRATEALLVQRLIKSHDTVLALGGGAVEHPETARLLGLSGKSSSTPSQSLTVYLEAALDISLARCATEPESAIRPLLQQQQQGDHLTLRARFEQRLPLYRQAHLSIATAQYTADEVARQILDKMRRPAC
jgi:shikimate kinase